MWTNSCLSFLSVLLVLQLFLSTTAEPDYDYQRIVNGSEATIEEYPFTVSIQWFRYHLCGGVIISTEFILTSARCIETFEADELKVLAGSTARNNYESPAKEVGIKDITVYEQYNSTTWENDIAILELETPLDFSGANIKSIDFYVGSNPVISNVHLAVMGWGVLVEGASFNPINLQVKSMLSYTESHCAELLGNFSRVVDPWSMFCAYGFEEESNAYVGGGICEGDFGSPLVTTVTEQYPEMLLVGIASWGFKCNRGFPQIFTNLQRVRIFIENRTGLWSGKIPKVIT